MTGWPEPHREVGTHHGDLGMIMVQLFKPANVPERLDFLLDAVSRLYSKRFDQRVRCLGLSRAQSRVLACLQPNPGINQAGLAELLEIEPISLVRLLDNMADRGWVERRRVPFDRRLRQLYLTSEGEAVLAKVEALAEFYDAEIWADFSFKERRLLVRLLRKLHPKVTKRDGTKKAEGTSR
jgi:MarR family transcriptional regulator for hemolysin